MLCFSMNWGCFDSTVALLSSIWPWYLEMKLIYGVTQMLVNGGQSPVFVWGMVEQVWHLFWTEKGNPCRHWLKRRDKGWEQERREVRPLRGNVILRSSAPYTHSHTNTTILCWCAGWCTHAKRDECRRNKNNHWTFWMRLCVCAYACFVLTCMLVYMFL